MTASEPLNRVIGAILRDARERRMMLPEQSAGLLGITPRTVLALESGLRALSSAELTALIRLYRCGQDSPALGKLLVLGAAGATVALDREPGHACRLAACLRGAQSVRWLSTVLLPPPLQTRHYALAVAEPATARPGAPVSAAAAPLFVLGAGVIRRGGGTALLMAEQLEHLLRLADSGVDIRVVPQSHRAPQPPGHLVEMRLPAGRVLARPREAGVGYHRGDSLAAGIDAALAVTGRRSSREALEQAAAYHRARAEATAAQLSQTRSAEVAHVR